MKQISLCLLIVFLVACAPAPATQTSEAPTNGETSEVSPATATPEATATPAPSPTPESPTAILSGSPTWFDAEDVAGATLQTVTIAGTETQGWVLPDGRVIAADMDGDGKIERVSEYADEQGNKWYTYQNMKLGMGESGAIQLKPDAAKVLWERLFKELSEGQFAGKTVEQIKAKLLAGPADLWVPRAPAEQKGDYKVEWEKITCDLGKGMEVVLVGSKKQFDALPIEWQERLLDPETATSGMLTCTEDRHLVAVGVSTDVVTGLLGFDRAKLEKVWEKNGYNLSYGQRIAGKAIGRLPMIPFDMLSDYMEESAFVDFAKHPTSASEADGQKIVEAFPEEWWEAQAE